MNFGQYLVNYSIDFGQTFTLDNILDNYYFALVKISFLGQTSIFLSIIWILDNVWSILQMILVKYVLWTTFWTIITFLWSNFHFFGQFVFYFGHSIKSRTNLTKSWPKCFLRKIVWPKLTKAWPEPFLSLRM